MFFLTLGLVMFNFPMSESPFWDQLFFFPCSLSQSKWASDTILPQDTVYNKENKAKF